MFYKVSFESLFVTSHGICGVREKGQGNTLINVTFVNVNKKAKLYQADMCLYMTFSFSLVLPAKVSNNPKI